MQQLHIFDTHDREWNQIESDYRPDAQVVLHHGDTNAFVTAIPDNSVKLIITSPPYNLGKDYESRVSIEQYLETQEQTITQLIRVLRDDGSLCWQVGNFVQKSEVFPLDIYYYNIFKNRFKLYLRNRIIWFFGHGLHASKRFSGRYETILWFTKSDKYTFNLDNVRVPSKYPGKRHYKGNKIGQLSGNPKGKNPSDIWEIVVNEWESGLMDIPNVKNNHPEKTDHPCQFPVELVERCVLALTDEGDTVFDPYAGVGSSLIAAIKHDRRAIGSEKERDYYDTAGKRIRDYLNGTLRLRPMGTPVYSPTGREKVAQMPEEWKATNSVEDR